MTDKIEEIRARHTSDTWRRYELKAQVHDDRATLLAEVERQRAEIEGLRAQMEERYISMRVRQLEEALDAERQTARWRRAEIERLDLDLQRLSAMGSNNKWLLERLAEQRKVIERLRADRRERIATAALQGLLSEGDLRGEPQTWAERATVFADALTAKLDREEGKP